MIPSSNNRRFNDAGHRPPSGRHCLAKLDGGDMAWHGTSRIADRPGRQRSNRASWARLLRGSRRKVVAATSSEAARHG